jgi:hypothetical protein
MVGEQVGEGGTSFHRDPLTSSKVVLGGSSIGHYVMSADAMS